MLTSHPEVRREADKETCRDLRHADSEHQPALCWPLLLAKSFIHSHCGTSESETTGNSSKTSHLNLSELLLSSLINEIYNKLH